MNIEERLTRLEDMVWNLALMTTNGNPGQELSNVDPAAAGATRRFLEDLRSIEAERGA